MMSYAWYLGTLVVGIISGFFLRRPGRGDIIIPLKPETPKLPQAVADAKIDLSQLVAKDSPAALADLLNRRSVYRAPGGAADAPRDAAGKGEPS